MFVGGLLPKDGNASAADTTTTTTATRRPTTSSTGKAGGIREGETRGGGEWTPPPSVVAPANGIKATGDAATPGQPNGENSEDGPAAGDGLWGYRSSLSSKGCWKVDAWAAARRDNSVELGFDSVAFDVFVRPEEERGQEISAAAGKRAAARHDDGKAPSSSSGGARAVVTNVVPYRLNDGLPRELGPLLFSDNEVASLLAGDPDHHHHPPSRGARRGRAKQTMAVEPEEAHSSPAENHEHEEKEEEEEEALLWVRKKDPSSSGQVLSHVHRGVAADAGTVEVRIRGESLDVGALARVGLPQDMSALAVAAANDVIAAGNSKRTGDVVGVVSGGTKQERRKPRAAAH